MPLDTARGYHAKRERMSMDKATERQLRWETIRIGMEAMDTAFGNYHTTECDVAHDTGSVRCVCFHAKWEAAIAAIRNLGDEPHEETR